MDDTVKLPTFAEFIESEKEKTKDTGSTSDDTEKYTKDSDFGSKADDKENDDKEKDDKEKDDKEKDDKEKDGERKLTKDTDDDEHSLI